MGQKKKLDVRLLTEVVTIRKNKDDSYELVSRAENCTNIDTKFEAVWSFCGRWKIPRVLPTFNGEDIFVANGGIIRRNPQALTDCDNRVIAIIGHGAFAVECARASLERGAKRVIIVDRKKSGICPVVPRLASYAINATPGPMTSEQLTSIVTPFLDLLPECANAFSARAVADWYFLARQCGKLEVHHDSVVHDLGVGVAIIETGGSTESIINVDSIISCIGFELPPPVQIEPIVGLWVCGDPLRPVWRECYRAGANADDYWTTSSVVALSGLLPLFADCLRRPKYWRNLLSLLPLPVATRDCDWTTKHVSRTVHLLRHSAPKRVRRLLQASEEERSQLVIRLSPPEHLLKECLADWQRWCEILKVNVSYPICGLEDFYNRVPTVCQSINIPKKKRIVNALVHLAQTQFQTHRHARLEAGDYVAPKSPSPESVVIQTLADLHQRGILVTSSGRPAVVADLGCGDGRWLIEACGKYGCTGIGMELDDAILARARRNIEGAGLTASIQLSQDDFLSEKAPNFGEFDVIIAYLFRDGCRQLVAKLNTEVRIGATIVCVGFALPLGWRPISEYREGGLSIRLYER